MIKQILDEISSEPSTKKKVEIVRKYKDNETFKRVLYLGNSPRIKFYIKIIPNYIKSETLYNLDEALDKLSILSKRELTGNDASTFLADLLSKLSSNDAYVIEKVISKDLKIEIKSKLNDAIPNLIEESPYMGAKVFDKKKALGFFKNGNPCYIDVKEDGRFNNCIIRSGEVENTSRPGEPVSLGNAKFIEELSKYDDCVLNGELLISGESNRAKANGIVMSLIDIFGKSDKRSEKENSKKISDFEKTHECTLQEMVDRLEYRVWDMVGIDDYFNGFSKTPYKERWENLVNLIEQNNSSRIHLVEKRVVYSFEEAMLFFEECLLNGLEGCILKSMDGEWKDGKPVWQMKMKLEMSVDLKITGLNYGEKGKKNEHLISSLRCESSDGLLVTNVQGLDDDTMIFVTENKDKLLGTIVDTKCSGTSKDKNGNYSMHYPRLGNNRFRDDKKVADSLQEILAIEKAAKSFQ